MYSITTASGQRMEYPTYHEFSEAKKELCTRQAGWLSYYDRHGITHVCMYRINGTTVLCCGISREFQPVEWDRQGYRALAVAADICKTEMWDEFLGWSI